MNVNNIKHIYFLGIGGIGMSALARYFKAMGKQISGYDKTSTVLTKQLQEEGMNIHFEDNTKLIPSNIDWVIYTPAIPKTNNEYEYFIRNHYTTHKRAEVLGMITQRSFTISVAGTHGKTTTSAIIAHILKQSNMNCTAFLGGIATNYRTNLILPSIINLSKDGDLKSSIMVVEADEYDRSLLHLQSDIAVITSIDADHLDVYGNIEQLKETFSLFAKQINTDGKLIMKKGLCINNINDANTLTYSFKEDSDYYVNNITLEDGKYVFDIITTTNRNIKGVKFNMSGKHNIENAVAAIAVSQQLGISNTNIVKALESFSGVKRRFEYHIKTKKLVFIDDYAHHPEELKACISAAKEMYPDKKITGIFQPHLYSRTRDFADDFARSLELLDEVILLDIYPARELPIEGVSSEMLLKKIALKKKLLYSKEELIEKISKHELEVLLTLGAGDIDKLVEQIKKILI